jgi:hypothetical protein
MSTADTRTASQRIEDLEKVVTMLYQAAAENKNGVEGAHRALGDLPLIKEALKLLNKKTEAIIQTATPETGITVKSVSDLVVKMNVEDLQGQVKQHLANGDLTPADEAGDDSYLVCEEFNKDGTLANPRIQFRMDSQDEANRALIKGKKVGDTVEFGENRFDAKILEIYTIVPRKAPGQAPAAAPAADASAPPATADSAASDASAQTASA